MMAILVDFDWWVKYCTVCWCRRCTWMDVSASRTMLLKL